jgi:ABC-type amino acid transport substrate-binding protein/ABC-type Na+ efflux pump permease subunit
MSGPPDDPRGDAAPRPAPGTETPPAVLPAPAAAVARLRAGARLALARRDLLEFVRDRRTLFVTLLLPMAMYPILALSTALGVRTAITDIDSRQAPRRLRVALTGAFADARRLADRIQGLPRPEEPAAGWPAEIEFDYASAADAQRAVARGDIDLWIDVPADADAALEGVGTLELEARGPPDRPIDSRVRDQFSAVIRTLGGEARRRRIDRAGLPASVLAPVEMRFTGMPESAGRIQTRGILPTAAGGAFVLLAVLTMTGAFYPAIDAIAGEKERGTIETLLIAPCAAIDIVAGKFLAVWAVALATLAANLVSLALTAAVSLRFLPADTGLLPESGLATVVVVSLLAFVGLSAVAAAMCLAVTTASKSGKEAQNTLTPVLLFASTLAGAGLLSDARTNRLLPAVPFAGQVALARATLVTDEPVAPAAGPAAKGAAAFVLPLGISLVSSAALVWLLLRGTAALLTDEEVLFRGPDAATGVFARPPPRRRPTVGQGLTAVVLGFAALWYAQGVATADYAVTIPALQLLTMLLPLGLLLAWQRVSLRRTFSLERPAATVGGGGVRGAVVLAAAALLGAGLFVVGAGLLLAVRGGPLSEQATELARQLVGLVRSRPVWLSWVIIAVVPAICEELFFRGWVQAAFLGARPGRGRIVAAVVTQAAAFALFHLLPERMPQAFVLGLATGCVTLLSRSLLPAVVLHAAHNSMAIVILWLAGALTGPEPDPAAFAGGRLPAQAFAAGLAAVVTGAVLLGLALGTAGRRRRGIPSLPGAAATLILGSAFAGSCALAEPQAAAPQPDGRQRVRVAAAALASALEWTPAGPEGVMADIWGEFARRLALETEFVRVDSFHELLEAIPAGRADVALGPIAITEERERALDLTHPVFHSGLRLAVRRRQEGGFLAALGSLVSWDLLGLLGAVLLLALVSGHLLWWFERGRNPESFPNRYPRGVLEAIWWIASTIVSGGCDNKHVASGLGRMLALGWMAGGIVLIAALTSMLTATLTAERVSGSIHGPRDLAGRVVGCQDGAVTVAAVRRRGAKAREFSRLEEAFEALALGMVDAVAGENNQLAWLVGRPGRESLRLVGPLFESFDYGLGLPDGSPLREPLNTAILQMREDGTIDRLRERWLGSHD